MVWIDLKKKSVILLNTTKFLSSEVNKLTTDCPQPCDKPKFDSWYWKSLLIFQKKKKEKL